MTAHPIQALGSTLLASARPAPRPAGSPRADHYLGQIDAVLATLAPAARRAMVVSLIDGWERLYDRFIATDGESMPVTDPADPPSASDFLLTIAGLSARLGPGR